MESGSLSHRGVAELLRGFGDRRATGCLHVVRDDQNAKVWLRDGAVYTASAPEARARLGDRLVGASVLDPGQLEAALEAQRTSPQRQRIGELLVGRGMIDRETLRTYVQAQILDSVTAALSWREGTWTFQEDDETPEDAPLDMSLENLLMDAARRLEEWEVIRGSLGSLDAVVDFAPRQAAAEVALTPDEWSLMTHIDGQASVAEIADTAGYGQFETARIIYGLMSAGIVHVLPDDEEAPDMDRESLLSEFAGLGDGDGDGGRFDRPIVRERLVPGRRTVLPPPGSESPEKRGLLDRFRKA